MTYLLMSIINLLFRWLQFAIFIQVLLSWFSPGQRNRLSDFFSTFTEPFLKPARRLQEKIIPDMRLDFSPVIAILLLEFLQSLINRLVGLL